MDSNSKFKRNKNVPFQLSPELQFPSLKATTSVTELLGTLPEASLNLTLPPSHQAGENFNLSPVKG